MAVLVGSRSSQGGGDGRILGRLTGSGGGTTTSSRRRKTGSAAVAVPIEVSIAGIIPRLV
jgi:hypothetical protein